MSRKIGIIGGGLSGLVIAHLLKKENVDFELLEARERLGGRILTIADASQTTMEMGATWFGLKHTYLVKLLEELGLHYFEQYQKGKAVFEASTMSPVQTFQLPQGDPPSYRISGGSSTLIEALGQQLPTDSLFLNRPVSQITLHDDEVKVVSTDGSVHHFDKVITTLPPYLLASTIDFKPFLPKGLLQIAHSTQTWMGTSIKFAVSYERAFWRENNYAGVGFSNSSVASEIHDHTSASGDKFALKGFLVPGAFKLTTEERERLVKEQLIRFYGPDAAEYVSYKEYLWATEKYTMGGGDNDLIPHQNQGHPIFRQPFLDDRLLVAGSETSSWYGGYMEGAVFSALQAAKWVNSSANS